MQPQAKHSDISSPGRHQHGTPETKGGRGCSEEAAVAEEAGQKNEETGAH